MIKLLTLFIIAMFFAYQSEKYTRTVTASGQTYTVHKDTALILLMISLVLFAGLRTSYNDTGNYINGYNSAPGFQEFLSDPENLNPFTNPLFFGYQSFLKSMGCSSQVLIFTTAMLTQVCFVLFFKRYSHDFTFSIFLYFTLGTFCVSLATIKQMTAMAVLTLAFPYAERKRWIRFYLVVFLAVLLHTYALAFLILPFFKAKPWKLKTLLLLAGTVFLLMNFREIITEFMDQANELGKTLADYEVFDSHTINPMRLAVYAVPPVISLIFQKWLNAEATPMDNLFMQMSIISLSFMLMGTQSGANMFARMAHYFEIGTICILPWMIRQPFVEKSHKVITAIAVACFGVFFVYAYGMNMRFDDEYKVVHWLNFLSF